MTTTRSTFERKHPFLICVDSDGCAMDTMDIKHFRCFGPCMIEQWGLQQWQEPLLERWNQVNLYSMTRGINRFKALAILLTQIDQTLQPVAGIKAFALWAETAPELSNSALEALIPTLEVNRQVFEKALAWSKAVNASIKELPEEEKRAFPGAPEGLKAAHSQADVAVVSSANRQAVEEEWQKHGMLKYTDIVMAQDSGSKGACIKALLETGYAPDKVLMVGDAPGDLQAAVKNGVLYYPILVRREAESWKRFVEEALPKLLSGDFAGEYQQKLLDEFNANLCK